MNARIIANGILRALAIIVGILLFLFFLYKIQSVLIYLVIATVLSLIARPILSFFKNRLEIAEYFGRDHYHDAFSIGDFWCCFNVYPIDQRTRAQYIFTEHRGIKKKNV